MLYWVFSVLVELQTHVLLLSGIWSGLGTGLVVWCSGSVNSVIIDVITTTGSYLK